MGENENAGILLLTNAILKDTKLSLKAKGLYFNMIFLIEEQDLTINMIKKMNQVDSERSIKMCLTELENGGYIIRKTLQDGEASWDLNRSMNKKSKKEVTVNPVNETIKNQTTKPVRKKVQPKKNSTRKAAKKTGLNRAISSFLKEFF
ncbi:hypothetical protein ACFPES_15585 [Paenibacillus sp. GCM10023248]|uniref:hypothetical protein n=1 Tax=unclassified Paenibacillus TaxID=185978 RepID=UPI002377F264|nr:hypothetical protein [Paenibacillus sp. MAHUQ-63]MDD9268463.1 hypothetical protein [Paenibacillus sp. MAHUQ-63]